MLLERLLFFGLVIVLFIFYVFFHRHSFRILLISIYIYKWIFGIALRKQKAAKIENDATFTWGSSDRHWRRFEYTVAHAWNVINMGITLSDVHVCSTENRDSHISHVNTHTHAHASARRLFRCRKENMSKHSFIHLFSLFMNLYMPRATQCLFFLPFCISFARREQRYSRFVGKYHFRIIYIVIASRNKKRIFFLNQNCVLCKIYRVTSSRQLKWMWSPSIDDNVKGYHLPLTVLEFRVNN